MAYDLTQSTDDLYATWLQNCDLTAMRQQAAHTYNVEPEAVTPEQLDFCCKRAFYSDKDVWITK